MAELADLLIEIGAKLNDEGFQKALDSMSKTEKKTTVLDKVMSKFVFTWGDVINTAKKFANIMTGPIQAAAEQEFVTTELASAMQQAGTFTEKALKHNLAYASSLEKLSVYNDELITSVQKQLTNFGIEGEYLDKLTKATLDLAAAKGMDLKAAGDLVAKSVGSSTNALTRYGIEVTGAVGSTQRLETATRNIEKIFGGSAQAQTQTFTGTMKQLHNAWSGAQETLGLKLLPYLTQMGVIVRDKIIPAINKFFENEEFINGAINTTISIVGYLIESFSKIPESIEFIKNAGLVNFFRDLNEIIAVSIRSIENLGKKIISVFDPTIEGFKILAKTVKEWGKDTDITSKDVYRNWSLRQKQTQRDIEQSQNDIVKNQKENNRDYLDNIIKTYGRVEKENKKTNDEIKFFEWDKTEYIRQLRLKESNDFIALQNKQRGTFSETVGAFGAALGNFSTLQSTLIQNELQEKMNASALDYETKKNNLDMWLHDQLGAVESREGTEEEHIEWGKEVNKAYQEQLKYLDDERSRHEKKLQEDAKRDEINRRKELKPYLIAEAVANTALGFTKALAQGGLFGIVTGALVAAAGAAQIAVIQAQKFANGTMNAPGGLALVGEIGAEIVNIPRGSQVIPSGKTRDILTGRSGDNINLGDISININGNVDKNNVDEICNKISRAVKSKTIEGIKLAKTINKEGSFREKEAY